MVSKLVSNSWYQEPRLICKNNTELWEETVGALGWEDEESDPRPPQRHAPPHTSRGCRHRRIQWLHGAVHSNRMKDYISFSGGFKTPQINWSWVQSKGGSHAGRSEDRGESQLLSIEVRDILLFRSKFRSPWQREPIRFGVLYWNWRSVGIPTVNLISRYCWLTVGLREG